jgi:hypothetical protein
MGKKHLKSKRSRKLALRIKKLSLGQSTIFILAGLMLLMGFMLTSGGFSRSDELAQKNLQQETGICCESGDGENCKPITESGKTFSYGGKEYGLLKSNIKVMEVGFHLVDTGQKFNGNPIIRNDSQTQDPREVPKIQAGKNCNQNGDDEVWGPGGDGKRAIDVCTPIPDDALIYVCKKSCQDIYKDPIPELIEQGIGDPGNAIFDVYFSMDEYEQNGIPDAIRSCDSRSWGGGLSQQETEKFVMDQNINSNQTLQFNTFKIEKDFSESGPSSWLSPWCKPAVYLYPTKPSYINVKVDPKGPLTYTDPPYPSGGWTVFAETTGELAYQNKNYDYLYYEAKLSDNLIDQESKKGYVVSKEILPSLFKEILPKLGLNSKEQTQFSEYWLKVLPDSPYFYVGVVPKETLDNLSPLEITPSPQTVVRVNLYFKPLDKWESVSEPKLSTPNRSGFTVVEWGGLFKQDKDHPFTCMM